MAMRDPRSFLSDICDACDRTLSRIDNKILDDYRADETLRLACERLLGIVGEAISQLRRWRPDLAAQISSVERIIAFRNVLIHGYFKIVDDIVWEIMTRELPVLRGQAASLLATLGAEP